MKRLQTVAIVGIVLIAIVAFVRAQTSSPKLLVAAAGAAASGTYTVDQGDITVSVIATGSIQANQNVALSFPIPGRVVSINVTEGDHILKGQTIASIDPKTYLDALMLAQAKVNAQNVMLTQLTAPPRPVDINVAKAAINVAQAALKESQMGPDQINTQIAALNVEIAKNALWQQQLQRDADVNTKNTLLQNPRTAGAVVNLPSDAAENAILGAKQYNVDITKSQLNDQQHQYANVGSIAAAQAQITLAQNALDKLMQGGDVNDIAQAQANVKAAQAAVDQAQSNLDKTKLLAPFDGLVAKLNLNLGQQTPAQGAAALLLDTSSFYVDLPIDETDISKIQLGQSADLTFDSLPTVTLKGKVIRVASTGSTSGNVVTYMVRVQIDPAGQPLISTMSTTASIITTQVTGVIRVNTHFIRLNRANGTAIADVRQPDGTVAEVPVTLGNSNDTYSEVKSGLKVGDILVIPSTATGS